jgi:hypothetical protein
MGGFRKVEEMPDRIWQIAKRKQKVFKGMKFLALDKKIATEIFLCVPDKKCDKKFTCVRLV